MSTTTIFEDGASAASLEVPESVIIPPPEIRNIVDKTANFVSRNGLQFEEKIREKEKLNPKFSFLNHIDPYHVYYQWRLGSCNESRNNQNASGGGGGSVGLKPSFENNTGIVTTTTTATSNNSVRFVSNDSLLDGSSSSFGNNNNNNKNNGLLLPSNNAAPPIIIPSVPPPSFEFIHDIPPIPLEDSDIIKLTALFTAKNGREFMNQLAAQESRNSLFDFLRASHPLFSFFAVLVEQYQRVLSPSSTATSKVFENSRSKTKILERISQRAEFSRRAESQRKFVEEEKERERAAFASIDWYDFVVVDTIDVSGADLDAELPIPATLLELQCETLQLRRKALMLSSSTPAAIVAAVNKLEQQQPIIIAPTSKPEVETVKVSITTTKDRINLVSENKNTLNQPPLVTRTKILPTPSLGPMKIKQEIVPRKNKQEEITQICPRCGLSVPVSEMEEHMRIELLDPKWREQRQQFDQTRRETNLNRAGEQVVHSLKAFAEYRKDIFGGDEIDLQKKINEDQERQRAEAKTKIIWDGHTASIATATQKLKDNVPIDEQIASIHKAKGLLDVSDNMMLPDHLQLPAPQQQKQQQNFYQNYIAPGQYMTQSNYSNNQVGGNQLYYPPIPGMMMMTTPRPQQQPQMSNNNYTNYSQNMLYSHSTKIVQKIPDNNEQQSDESSLPPWLSPSNNKNELKESEEIQKKKRKIEN